MKKTIRILNSRLLPIFYIFYSLFFINKCSDPSSNDKVTFSGTVTPAPEGVPDGKDTTDFFPEGQAGVIVSLYAPVELDPSICPVKGRAGGQAPQWCALIRDAPI